MPPEDGSEHIAVGLVIDQLTFDRLGPVIGHLSIGLLDYVSSITLITPASAALRLSLGPVRVIQYHPPTWPIWGRHAGRLIRGFGEQPPTVIHAISSRSFRLAQELAQRTSRPLVGQLLGSEDIRPKVQSVFQRMAKVIASSEPLLMAARSRHLVDHDRLTMIRPGLLTEPAPTCLDQDRTPTILCMSAFEQETGVDRLVLAIKKLVAEGHELMLFLLSRGPHEHRLRRLVEQSDLIKHVTFGRPIDNWSQAMVAADIFLVPGDVDRVDVRLLHAMAAGMAAVTGECPNSDFVIQEQTALVCPQPTATSLAGAIKRLLQDRDLARRLASRALEHCKKYHSLSRMAEQTAEVYRTVAATTHAVL